MTAQAKATTGRRKILHLITRLAQGGAQDNTLVTCELHDRTRYEVHLASNPEGRLVQRALTAADVFHPVPHLAHPLGPVQDTLALAELVGLFRRQRFDLVHGHSSKAGFLGRLAARLTRTRFVFTYHGFSFHDFMGPYRKNFFIYLERLASAFADHYITLSENDRKLAIALRMMRAENSTVIRTGIDYTWIDEAEAAYHHHSPPLSGVEIPAGYKTIVLVGRMDPQKAPHLLVSAYEKVRRRFPKTRLLLVGEGELLPQVRSQIAALGLESSVQLLGHRTDVAQILLRADIFAFSSLWEAMGRSMVEAMLMGKPVVAPAIYGIPEVVEHEKTGLLYEVGNVDQLAERLCWYLEHPQRASEIAAAGRHRTRAMFDARTMIRRIENIYEQIFRQASSDGRTP